MSELTATVDMMKDKFDANAAAGLDLVFQFDIEDAQGFNVVVNNGSCEINDGNHSDPSVTLKMGSDTLTGLMDGSVDGMQAFMAGRLSAQY